MRTIILSFPDFPDDTALEIENGNPFIFKGQFTVEINCEAMAARIAKDHDIAFFSSDEWFEFQNHQWTPLHEINMKKLIRDYLKTEMRRNDVQAHDRIPRSVYAILESLKSRCFLGEMLPKLGPDLIPVRNGLLQWDADKKIFTCRPYKRDDMIFHTLDVEYHPEAKSTLFDKKIREVIPDEDDRRVVQEYMGAALFAENRSRKFMVLQGEGGCGKSLLQKLLTSILTVDRTFDLNFDVIRQNFAFSALTTQTLLTASEAAAKAFRDSTGCEFVKKAVGGDFFQTAQKFKNLKVDHHGFFSLLIVSNNDFHFQYDGLGNEFKDRAIIIQFTKHIAPEKQDKDLAEKLLKDRSAILNWFLAGAERVRKNDWNITLSPTQISRRDRIIEATKGIELFVRNHVVFASGNSLPIQDAYKAYAKLCKTAGFEYLTEKTFQHRLHKVMLETFSAIPCNTIRLDNGDIVRGYRHYAINL